METLQSFSPDQSSNVLKNSESVANVISELFQKKRVVSSSLSSKNQRSELSSDSHIAPMSGLVIRSDELKRAVASASIVLWSL